MINNINDFSYSNKLICDVIPIYVRFVIGNFIHSRDQFFSNITRYYYSFRHLLVKILSSLKKLFYK